MFVCFQNVNFYFLGTLTLKQRLDYDVAVDDVSSREFKLKVTAAESKIGGYSSSVLVSLFTISDSSKRHQFCF